MGDNIVRSNLPSFLDSLLSHREVEQFAKICVANFILEGSKIDPSDS